MNAEHLIQEYASLSKTEQRKFDKRYRSLKSFTKQINALADLVRDMTDEQSVQALEKFKSFKS